MIGDKEVIALIPARSGSKSIKDKNIMSMGGKPLIAHSIGHAKESALVDRVIVSTDSEYYAEIARSYGAETPFLRPAEISGDAATDLEVFRHALEYLRRTEGRLPEICVHLRPTCPIREPGIIDRMIRILADDPGIDSVRSVSKSQETPFKMWFMGDGGRMRPAVECGLKEAYNLPRQGLPMVYIQNASVDVVRSSTIMEKNSMTGDSIYGYVMETFYDIDTAEQFENAARAMNREGGLPQDKTFCFDIDGVIATLTPDNDYAKAKPIVETIAIVNRLFELGNRIYLHTARGFVTGQDWSDVTRKQLRDWGVKYGELRFGKPAADFYIDDRMISMADLTAMSKGE